ncbi:GNAT family N-acetyltransferase [Paenibacillus sp. V4I5]|uniref:GNAT family N-acetyltransferase n=1 Tax=Paenibacillus sp. V4I5 TaxID=3042306 RepID=UPI00278CEF10|nr:GNAT family N-acetyltransferase [Paenibacillus sp. V4I5]MDQ0920733.1 ribosomal protein S18 acetylase RimI-like enzyme [Paenibacillus sp. V4I5]
MQTIILIVRGTPGTEIFVAEEETGELLGFLEVKPHKDNLSGIEQGYIVAIAVSPQGEGKGVGKALMTKAEEWSSQKGYRQLILNVFIKNDRAVNFYKHLNYEIEVVKMVKELSLRLLIRIKLFQK